VCGGDEPGDDDGVYGESGLCVGSSRASLLHNAQPACLLLVAISREASAPSPVRHSLIKHLRLQLEGANGNRRDLPGEGFQIGTHRLLGKSL